MNRIPTPVGRWLAAASACTVIGAFAPATAGASAAPPPVPADYVTLVDDTNHIAIMVPATWTDVQTGAVEVATGTAPHIAASPNVQSFLDTFDTPGVRYIGFPYTADPSSLIAQYGLEAGCSNIGEQPYDRGGFVGVVQVGTGCGAAGAATWNMIAANGPDQSFTAVVQIQTASPADQADMDAVLSTFGSATVAPTNATTVPATTSPVSTTLAATPTLPPTTAPATTVTVPAAVAPTTVPAATVPAVTTPTTAATGATTVPAQGLPLTDDTGLLTVQVPTTWTYHETAPSDAGQAIIYASPDGQAPEGTVPSLIYIGGDFIADTAAVLSGMGELAAGCTATAAEPYDDNVFVGHMQTYTQCNGTETVKVIIVANPPSQSTTVTLIVTMPVFDEATLSMLLQTFNVTR